MLIEQLLNYFMGGGQVGQLVDQEWWPDDRPDPATEGFDWRSSRGDSSGEQQQTDAQRWYSGRSGSRDRDSYDRDWGDKHGRRGDHTSDPAPTPDPAPIPGTTPTPTPTPAPTWQAEMPPLAPFLNPFLGNPGNTRSDAWHPPASEAADDKNPLKNLFNSFGGSGNHGDDR